MRPFLSTWRPVRPRRLARPPLLRLLTTALLLVQAPAAQAADCRLALVLALDVSGSVSAAEDRLQRSGLAAALLAPDVVQSFLQGGPVALYVFEWANSWSQAALLPGWAIIDSEADLVAVADAVAQRNGRGIRSAIPVADGTAVGAALAHAAAALNAGPNCSEQTVDVSGDGVNNDGIEPRTVIAALYDGITVNALVIHETLDDPMLDRLRGGDLKVGEWFARTILHGPRAFLINADGFEDYERAMTAKLRRELEMPIMSGWPGRYGAG